MSSPSEAIFRVYTADPTPRYDPKSWIQRSLADLSLGGICLSFMEMNINMEHATVDKIQKYSVVNKGLEHPKHPKHSKYLEYTISCVYSVSSSSPSTLPYLHSIPRWLLSELLFLPTGNSALHLNSSRARASSTVASSSVWLAMFSLSRTAAATLPARRKLAIPAQLKRLR